MPGERDSINWWGGNGQGQQVHLGDTLQYQIQGYGNVPYQQYTYPISSGRFEYEPSHQRVSEDWLLKYGKKCQDKHEKRLSKKSEGEEGGSVINNFLVGCDPEFVALDGNGRTMPLNFEEEEIGTDHGGRVGEFRPKPCKGVFALTKRLQKLILSPTLGRVCASKFRAGARINEESLGGHVHFGFPIPKVEYETANGQYVYDERGDYKVKKTEDRAIVTALDRITSILEHLDILPLKESVNRRKGAYGRFGDVRDSNGHMEYRSMCSWLYDPKVAFLCLTAAKIAAADPKGTLESLNKVTSFSGLQKWLENYKSKDSNASRAVEKLGDHKLVQVDPDVDFRERWRTLGL